MPEPADPRPPKGSDFFATDHLLDGIGTRSARSGALMMTAKAIEMAIRFATLIAMARLLSPAEFGLYGMAIATVSFQSELANMGFATAVLQSRELSARLATGLFWVQVGLSSALTLLSVLLAPALAGFFGRPELSAMIAVAALGTWISSLGGVHRGLLLRQMRFRGIAGIRLSASVVAALVGLALALRGMGSWSLIGQMFAVQVFTVLCLWALCSWRPQLPEGHALRADADFWGLLRFGRNIWLSRTSERFSFELPAFVLGRLANASEVGLLQNAQRWAGMPAGEMLIPLRSVSIGMLSRVRDDEFASRRYARLIMLATSSIILPLLTFFLIDAPRVIDTLLGTGWEKAVVPFQLLAFVGALDMLRRVISWVAAAEGRTGTLAKWSLWRAAAVSVGIVVGAGTSSASTGVAAGIAIASVATTLPFVASILRPSSVRVRDVAAGAVRPLAAAVLASLALGASNGLGDFASPRAAFLFGAALFGAVYAGSWLALPGGVRQARAVQTALAGRA